MQEQPYSVFDFDQGEAINKTDIVIAVKPHRKALLKSTLTSQNQTGSISNKPSANTMSALNQNNNAFKIKPKHASFKTDVEVLLEDLK